jgi:hypothetical protein
MRLLFGLTVLFASQVSYATCMLVDQGPAQCNNGSGSGASVVIVQGGADKCPGNRVAFCPKKPGLSLAVDHNGKEDRCVTTVCHATVVVKY